MQYPLGEHEREQIASKTGKKLDEITLDAVMRNQIAPDDIKISKEMLYAQGQVAKENGNDPMEKNFERAAELVDVPDDVILKMYDKLRPNRSHKAGTGFNGTGAVGKIQCKKLCAPCNGSGRGL